MLIQRKLQIFEIWRTFPNLLSYFMFFQNTTFEDPIYTSIIFISMFSNKLHLFSCHLKLLSLLLLLFSPCSYFFPCCCYSSHMVLFVSFDEVIKLLIIWLFKLTWINEKFNNLVVKTGCEKWLLLLYIWESPYLRIEWIWKNNNLIIWSVLINPKNNNILENQLDFHSIMRNRN
jgi:hypothetical protein